MTPRKLQWGPVRGSVDVTAADVTATYVDIVVNKRPSQTGIADSKTFRPTVTVSDSSGKIKTGVFQMSYNKTAGTFRVANNGASSLVDGDVITYNGNFYS